MTDTAPAWTLTDLYTGFDDPEIDATYARIEAAVTAFLSVRDELSPDMPAGRFLELCAVQEGIARDFTRLFSFAGLTYRADTSDQRALAAMARAQQESTAASNKMLFFDLWWKALDDENAARLIAPSGDYAYWLTHMRSFTPHTLSEAEEKVIAVKDITGSNALTTLYSTITNGYTYTLEGHDEPLSRGELMVLVRNPDPDVRAAAYQELYRVYGQAEPVLGQIYQALVRDWRNENVDLRGFDSPIAVRNLGNDLPGDVIDTLLRVTRRNVGLFRRVFAAKARLLGVEKLRRYDLYAPVSASERTFTWDEAIDLTMEAFTRFDPSFAAMARRVLDEGHLDATLRPGKDSGAFCWTVLPSLTPWVLTNFQGRIGDVSTLAHELGHAVHSMLAADHSHFTQHACLPLAETASTFAEMTLADLLAERETDPAVQRDLLLRELDDSYATIVRQVYFAFFEISAHEAVAAGASVTELSDLYAAQLTEQFGDSIEVSEEFRHEWVSIPHIFATPFYVYAYAFGQLLVYALYQRYLDEGASFVPSYLAILAAGGSKAPLDVLAAAGIDVTTEEFWQGGFDLIAAKVGRLEALATPQRQED